MKKLISTVAFVVLVIGLTHSAFAQGSDSTFKPSGKFSMQFFGDYDYMLSADTAGNANTKVPKGGTYYTPVDPKATNGQGGIWQKFYQAFDIRRVYLGYDYQFSPNVSAQLLLAHENGTLVNNASIVTGITGNTDTTTKDLKSLNKPSVTTLPTSSSGDIVLDGNRGLY